MGDHGDLFPSLPSSRAEQKQTSFVPAEKIRNLPAVQKTQVRFLGWEDPLEKEMATHSSILAWRIPWTEEPGGLRSMGLQRVRHDLATKPPPPPQKELHRRDSRLGSGWGAGHLVQAPVCSSAKWN